jgi:hypothetical protein
VDVVPARIQVRRSLAVDIVVNRIGLSFQFQNQLPKIK